MQLVIHNMAYNLQLSIFNLSNVHIELLVNLRLMGMVLMGMQLSQKFIFWKDSEVWHQSNYFTPSQLSKKLETGLNLLLFCRFTSVLRVLRVPLSPQIATQVTSWFTSFTRWSEHRHQYLYQTYYTVLATGTLNDQW